VTVLDLTLALAGPLCTQRLGDMGATIIKIEGPQRGDFTRNAPMRDVWLGGDTTAYLSLNRNKQSLALDLKNREGQELFYRLVATADVVVQNFRPGVADRLGISFERLKQINPRIVYVSISGYGDSGPMVDRPGQDLLVQGFSGTTFAAGTVDGLPHPSPIYIVDVAASHNACEAILAGLIQRDRRGVAVEAKVSLLAAVLEVQIQEVTTYLTTGRTGARGSAPYASGWMEPPYGIYPTQDGHIAIAQSSLAAIAKVLDAPLLAELAALRPDPSDQRALLAWRDAVYPALKALLADLPLEATVERLHAAGVWCGPVLDYAALARHEQAEGLFRDIEHPSAGRIRTLAPAISFSTDPMPELRPAPAKGEHTAPILEGLGVSKEAVERLRTEGVVA
jgi:crotonobetainyl-CoA:carnitine CoA-transferase CaiB-like acyl-CoA transferase